MRCIYIGSMSQHHNPAPNSRGNAAPASGCHIEGSAEEGAWIFQPDGDESAYYVDPLRDLIAETSAVTGDGCSI
jgi:hypothetical protein